MDSMAKISSILAICLLTSVSLSFGQSPPQQSGGALLSPTAPGQTVQPTPSMGDGVVAKVAAAGLGGFLAWILTKCVGLLILRKRLMAYLLIVINAHLRQYHESVIWLVAVKDKTIREGHLVKLAATYTKDGLDDLTEVREDCLKLLKKSELISITKLIQRMWEIEALLEGFCNSLDAIPQKSPCQPFSLELSNPGVYTQAFDLPNLILTGQPVRQRRTITPGVSFALLPLDTYKLKECVLNGSDVEFLQRKQDRILSYIKVLPTAIEHVGQLPLDYAGIQGAETLVTLSSATRPSVLTSNTSQEID